MPEDDPLSYLLTDYRAVQTTALHDGIWVKVFDTPMCFAARQYQTEQRLVVETHEVDGDDAKVRDQGGPDGALVPSRSNATDLTMSSATLSALLYGGIRPSLLAAGGRLTARDDATLRHADLFFVWPVAPLCQTLY